MVCLPSHYSNVLLRNSPIRLEKRSRSPFNMIQQKQYLATDHNRHRFVVRDFQYDETSLEKQKKEAEETVSLEREQQNTVMRLAKTLVKCFHHGSISKHFVSLSNQSCATDYLQILLLLLLR
jgi:hypothetical protein